MPLEIIISIVALLVILGLGRLGMQFGLFYELMTAVLLFFAMMVVLRYWYLTTVWVNSWFGGGPAYAAFSTYWALFLLGASPLIVLLNRLTETATPKYPKGLDAFLGGIFGVLSAVILVCCLVLSLSVVFPKWLDGYHDDNLIPPRFDRAPIVLYQGIEHELGITTNSPGHTRFPTFDSADLDDMNKYWK